MPTVEVQLYYAGGLNDESIPIKATMQEHLLSNRISRDLADRLGHDTSGKGSVQISWRPPHRCMQYDQCDVIDEGPDKFVLCERCWRLCCETSKKAAYPTYRPFGPGTEPGKHCVAPMRRLLHHAHDSQPDR